MQADNSYEPQSSRTNRSHRIKTALQMKLKKLLLGYYSRLESYPQMKKDGMQKQKPDRFVGLNA